MSLCLFENCSSTYESQVPGQLTEHIQWFTICMSEIRGLGTGIFTYLVV